MIRLPFLLLLLALATPALRAEEESLMAPPPPADMVFDEARLFVRNPERRQSIAEALAGLEEKHGFRMYFAIYDSLFDRSLDERAHFLRKEWLGDRAGMVLVVESDSGAFQIGRVEPGQQEIEPGTRIPVAGPSDLSAVELSGLIRSLEESLGESADTGDFVARLGIGMAEGVSALFDQRAAAPEGGTGTKTVVLAVGLIAATGLVALLVVAGLKRAEARALKRYLFPKIGVGIRLGAPYGGGKVISRTFRDRAPRP